MSSSTTGVRGRTGLALLALVSLYLVAASRFPFHGFWHDDGLYVQLGRALSEGGYQLEQLPGEPVQGRYPPLLPAALSLVWSAGADARTAFWVFCIPGACASAIGAWLWYLVLRRHERLGARRAVVCVALSALSPLTFLVTGCVMAEPLCLLLFPAAWLALGDGSEPRRAAAAGLVLGLAILARQSAVVVWLAAALALLIGRKPASAAWLSVAGLIVVAPWYGWSLLAADATADWPSVYRYYLGYEHTLPASTADLLAILPARARDLAVAVTAPLAGALLLPEVTGLAAVAPIVAAAIAVTVLLLVLAFVVGLGRALYERATPSRVALAAFVAAMLLYPYATWRFLVPWSPLVVALALRPADRWPAGAWSRGLLRAAAAASIVATSVMALQPDPRRDVRLWRETLAVAPHHELARFVTETLPAHAVLACDYDPYYYWATGRRAVMLADLSPVLALQGSAGDDPAGFAAQCLADHHRIGVTHVLTNPRLEVPVARMIAAWEAAGLLHEVHSDATREYRVLAVRLAMRDQLLARSR